MVQRGYGTSISVLFVVRASRLVSVWNMYFSTKISKRAAHWPHAAPIAKLRCDATHFQSRRTSNRPTAGHRPGPRRGTCARLCTPRRSQSSRAKSHSHLTHCWYQRRQRLRSRLRQRRATRAYSRHQPHHPFSRYRALERFAPRTRQQSPPR